MRDRLEYVRYPSRDRTLLLLCLLVALCLVGIACPGPGRVAGGGGGRSSGRSADDEDVPGGPLRTIVVAPLPGWPVWVGEVNYQISGLAFREGRLYGVGDQSSIEQRTLFEIVPPPREGTSGGGSTHSATRSATVDLVCRWSGGPHPDAEGMALYPSSGPPRSAFIVLEDQADSVIEIALDGCALEDEIGPITDEADNRGIEGVALSSDGETIYLVHETERTLLAMRRQGSEPARVITRIDDAGSLCDVAYDDRGTAATSDDRLLLLDRNRRQIFDVTPGGKVVGRWRLDRALLQKDPDGNDYSLVALEGLTIESREPDGSLLVYAATDTPPGPYPYHRKDGEDPLALYERKVGMLYRFRLPPFPPESR